MAGGKKYLLVTGGLVFLTVISGILLTAPRTIATHGGDDEPIVVPEPTPISNTEAQQVSATVTVASTCSMTTTFDTAHTATIAVNHYVADIGQTTIKTFCNDTSGYVIYAVGFSGNETGSNVLISDQGTANDIITGTATSGNTSNWAMKVTGVSGAYQPTIANSFNSYHAVPDSYAKVAYLGNKTDGSLSQNAAGSAIQTTYAAFIAPNQVAGTYVGKVKYILLHPSTTAAPVIPYMQTVAQWADLEIPSSGDSVRAIDQRDGKRYWVTRMSNGSVWMTQNLDLDLTHVTSGNSLLNSNNTDLNVSGSGIYENGYTRVNGVTYWNPSNSTGEASNWNGSSGDDGDKYYYTSGTTASDTVYTSLADCALDHTEDDCWHYHNGNYYSHATAVASSSGINGADVFVENSICPKGWRLPMGKTSDSAYADYAGSNYTEFATLLYGYGLISSLTSSTDSSIGTRAAPFYFTRSGSATDLSGISGAASGGYYFTSGFNNLLFLSSNGSVIPNGEYYAPWFGESVRCVMREGIFEIFDGYIMQEISTWANDLSVGDEVEAMDIRDGKIYTVAKLADGNIWMTQNLDHNIGDVGDGIYTSSDTDISSSWQPSSQYYTKSGNSSWSYSYAAESYDPGNLCWSGPGMTTTTSCGDDKHYHLGNYYNVGAAGAGDRPFTFEGPNGWDEYDWDASQSICPAGWTLPKFDPYEGETQFETMIRDYGWNFSQKAMTGNYTLTGNPLYFTAGKLYSGTLQVGGFGQYLSGRAECSDACRPYTLLFYEAGWTGVTKADNLNYGFSVRCVSRYN